MQKSVPYKAPQAKKGAADMSENAFPAFPAFPALGSTKPSKETKPSLDFKKTVMTPVQTQAHAPKTPKTPKAHVPAAPPTNPKERKHVFVTRYGDDGPEDYDGPPEEEEEEEDAEFNADIISTRRRGDKGIW
jgi:hypothetical protein